MFITITLLVLAVAMLYFGAEGLVSGSSKLAFKFGLKPLIVGLTIVAFGTSSPELVVSISAAYSNMSDIALGNVIGSNIFNIGLIVGIAALIKPMKVSAQVVKFDIIVMVIVSVLPFIMLYDGILSRVDGIILTALLIVYIIYNIKISKKNDLIESDEPVKKKSPVWLNIVFIIVGLAVLVFGANVFVESAVSLARFLNLSESVIGLTIVAMGTSLPELATSVVASLKGESDISLGNIVGSNIFNILAILGITSIITPISMGNISYVDLSIMLMFAVVLLPLARTGYVIDRKEGIIFLVLFAGYLYILLR